MREARRPRAVALFLVLVDIDALGRLRKAWPRPVVREDEGAAIGLELE
jgi:hypothetical protein